MELQPTHLRSEWVTLHPLQPGDFEALYAVASDPLIWEQHPNRNRYQRDVFENFFRGAIESKGAFVIRNARDGSVIGSTRYYDLDPAGTFLFVGYTFLARSCWGGGFNPSAKALLLNHAFAEVPAVRFAIGARNLRSQIAIGRLGARKIAEAPVAYHGEPPTSNFIYEIIREVWRARP
jgi:RimJ/RimL family protein N-acetyltransferase